MKQYGRIPHLPGSRTGAGDRDAALALAARCTGTGGGGDAALAARLTGAGDDGDGVIVSEKLDRSGDRVIVSEKLGGDGDRVIVSEKLGGDGDRVIVSEKLDGSCVAIVRDGGAIVALGRDGGPCAASRNPGRRAFAAWVAAQPARWAALAEGDRLIVEWLVLAHAVRYHLPHEPAIVIDLFAGRTRRPHDEVRARAAALGLPAAAVVHDGGPCPTADALAALGPHGRHGAIDPPEGVVYRVERARDGAVLAQAKYVRADLIPGRYLADHTGAADVWNRWTGPWTVADARAVP